MRVMRGAALWIPGHAALCSSSATTMLVVPSQVLFCRLSPSSDNLPQDVSSITHFLIALTLASTIIPPLLHALHTMPYPLIPNRMLVESVFPLGRYNQSKRSPYCTVKSQAPKKNPEHGPQIPLLALQVRSSRSAREDIQK
jgi:hypothetical protein